MMSSVSGRLYEPHQDMWEGGELLSAEQKIEELQQLVEARSLERDELTV